MCSGDPEALERIAYEFCEDIANNGVLYCETRYCPHLLANCGVDGVQCNGSKEQNCSPRKVVESVCKGIERGCKDFGVKVRTILCCMRHRPGKHQLVSQSINQMNELIKQLVNQAYIE